MFTPEPYDTCVRLVCAGRAGAAIRGRERGHGRSRCQPGRAPGRTGYAPNQDRGCRRVELEGIYVRGAPRSSVLGTVLFWCGRCDSCVCARVCFVCGKFARVRRQIIRLFFLSFSNVIDSYRSNQSLSFTFSVRTRARVSQTRGTAQNLRTRLFSFFGGIRHHKP